MGIAVPLWAVCVIAFGATIFGGLCGIFWFALGVRRIRRDL